MEAANKKLMIELLEEVKDKEKTIGQYTVREIIIELENGTDEAKHFVSELLRIARDLLIRE